MQLLKIVFFRWSFVVIILFYICFCGIIWTITLPLKSKIEYKPLEAQFKEEFDKSLRDLPNVYNHAKSINKIENNNLRKNNEYLINANEHEHRTYKDILVDVFLK